MKKMWKAIGILAGILAALIILDFAAMSLFNSPTYAWRVLRYGQSDTGDYEIFPARDIQNGVSYSSISRGHAAMPYEIEYPYVDGTRKEKLEDLLKRTDTRAFLIVRDDQLIFETYLQSSRTDIHTSFSIAKSFDSAMIGAAIQDGYIASVNDLVIRYIPEIAGRGLDGLTIRNLLRMDSGIRYLDNAEIPFYRQPFGDDAVMYYSPDLRKVALGVQARGVPLGETFRYNNYHPLLEGLIIERATHMHVAEYLQERIWKPMGAEFPASWSLDSERSGFEKMQSGVNARAVDYARFGLLYLHGGNWNGKQILPAAWVAESTKPDPTDTRAYEVIKEWPALGGYYGYHWWGLRNADGSYDFSAQGSFGQMIYVAPRKNAVIVRLGNAADPKLYWALVLQKIMDQMP